MTAPSKVIKYCPRCGSAEFVPQDGKSFKCNDCKFHFFVNSAAAVAAIIQNDKGEILLSVRGIEPNKGMLDLPGGFVDPGERAETAVCREIMEELNLKVNEIRFLASFPNEYVFSGYTVYTCDLGFVCKVSDFSLMRCMDDISGYLFVKPDKVEYDKICSNSIKQILKFYVENVTK